MIKCCKCTLLCHIFNKIRLEHYLNKFDVNQEITENGMKAR